MTEVGRRASDVELGQAPLDRREAEIEESSDAFFEAVLHPDEERGAPGLIRAGAVVAIAVAVSNLLNVVFQLVTAHLLTPAEYSLLVTMFAILLVANVPILSLQARVAREMAHALAGGRQIEAGGLLVETLRPLLRWGLIVLVIGATLAVPFAIVFNVERELPVIAVAATVLATVPLPIAWGGLQGSERFVALGLAQLGYALLKVVVGVGLAALGFGAAAIVFGLAAATLLTIALSLLPLAPLLAAGRSHARRKRRLLDPYTRGAAIVLILIAALTNMDLLAARAFFEDVTAGAYAAVSVAARGLLLLPLVATTVLFPRVAVLRDLAAEREHLLGGLAVVAALGLVPLVLFFAIPETLIDIAFGSDYRAGADWLGPLGVAMLLYALVEVYMFHFLALGRMGFGIVLGVGFAGQIVALALFHGDPDQIIAVQIGVAAALLVGSELFDRRDRWLGRSRTGEGRDGGSRSAVGGRQSAEAEEVGGADGRLPSVTAVVPTYNNAATLEWALESLAAQGYDGDVDLICVDGGSGDGTLAIAERFGARVVENPKRNEEEGRALGLEAAGGDLVLLLDADNELPASDWLERLVRASQLAPDVVSADPLFHEWRAQDPPVTRLCALMGGTDPLAIDLGWADRWATHLDRWTGLEVEVEDADDAVLVRIDPDRPPPMGSNGFLVRRRELLRTSYRPFVHSDVVGDLAEAGYRFARVREGVVHHYAPTLRAYARKSRRRARRSLTGEPPQRRGFRVDRGRVLARAAWSLTLIGPAIAAARGYRSRPDVAWALLPALYVITTIAYVRAAVRARLPGARARARGPDPPRSAAR